MMAIFDFGNAFQSSHEQNVEKKAFVIGDPIAHSLSPMLHSFWLNELGIDGAYGRYHVTPTKLKEFVLALRQSDIRGCNVTLPHKEAIALLVDEVTPTAKAIGAVNTLYFNQSTLVGDNTDAYGFAANLDDGFKGWDQFSNQQGSALILGAGGAARSVLYALIDRGFSHIILVNRTLKRAQSLGSDFKSFGDEMGCKIDILDQQGLAQSDFAVDLIVNTTSVGMGEGATSPLPLQLDLERLAAKNPETRVTDIVYTPLQTPLLVRAKSLGLPIMDGLGMLLHQAVPGFQHWFGQTPKVTENLRNHILVQMT